MDKQTLLTALSGTLDANTHVRKQSEEQLRIFELQPGFTAYLLDLILESDITLGIQISAAILFKNRINHYWIAPEHNTADAALYIGDAEKPSIKEKLIQTLLKTYKISQVRVQLSNSLYNILNNDKWDELVSIIKSLLSNTSDIDHVYTGLICLHKYTLNYRWPGYDMDKSTKTTNSNPVLDEITEELFPFLENLLGNLSKDESDNKVNDELSYLIVKIFKYVTYSYLPAYFMDPNKLGVWCHLHLVIINKPLPSSVLQEEESQRFQHPRIKTIKWCFANLSRLLSRHGGGFATKNKREADTESGKFIQNFLNNFVPTILDSYWKILELWSTKQVWLSESSLYHMISFFEQLIDTSVWPLILEKLDAILKYAIMPTLMALQETVELYEDDSDEYIRRFFDFNRDTNTADTASVNFIYRLVSNKFKSTVNILLNLINDVFNRRAASRGDLQLAMETEGALRILAGVSIKLSSKASSVAGQVDKILHTFVYPELLEETSTKFPWLTARACDTLAIVTCKYEDEKILDDIFQAVISCFRNEAQFPIQLTAVQALCNLIEEDSIAVRIADQVPQLMGFLLEMSKTYESDSLTTIMETYVEKFAKNLEPYATQLATSLVEQFVDVAAELIELGENVNVDKEYKASGILNTLTTLVIAMTSLPEVVNSLEGIVQDMIKIILDNAMVSYLSEALELLESILFSTRTVSPTMWVLFQTCIDAFDTYAYEYFGSFQPFFESIINFGFTNPACTIDNPQVQSFLEVGFKVLKAEEVDPLFADSTFQMIELTFLALNERMVAVLPTFLSELYDVFQALEAVDAFDGYMLHHLSILKVYFAAMYVDPLATMRTLHEKQFIPAFYTLWLKYNDDFQSVYGCKLQILAGIALLKGPAISLIPEDLISETVDLLLLNVAALPNAIKAKNEILAKDQTARQVAAEKSQGNEDDEDDENYGAYDDYDYEGDYEADEAELEALEVTPIDETNVFQVFSNELVAMQQQDPNKYQVLFGGIESLQAEMISQLISITQQLK